MVFVSYVIKVLSLFEFKINGHAGKVVDDSFINKATDVFEYQDKHPG